MEAMAGRTAQRRATPTRVLAAVAAAALCLASASAELQAPAFYPLPVGSIKAAGWCALMRQ